VQALHIDTPFFDGDILVTNNAQAGFGGMNIYDVTNPAHPTPLAEGVGDKTVPGQGKKAANEIHSVFAWDAGNKAYAVIVDNEEGLDVDIVDITNPKKARFIAEYDLDEMFPQIVQTAPPNLTSIFHHDMIVKEIDGKQVMLVSYWDGGYVQLDVTDPLDVTYIADTDFSTPDPEAAECGLAVAPEGNAHQAEFAAVIAAGGYDAVLIFNRTASDGCNGTLGMSVEGDIPAFGVALRAQGFAIFDIEDQYDDTACLAGDGTQLAPIDVGEVGDTLSFASTFDGWGYVHLYQNGTGKLTELDTYAVPEVHDPRYATGFGDLSVHEVATSHQQGDLAYISYYAAGLRVVEIVDGEIVEEGHFIDDGGNNFWGVQVFEHDGDEYVAASDRDFGLYIFRYTGGD